MKLEEYLSDILDETKRTIFNNMLNWTKETFPKLDLQMKWNQPMFLYKEKFIIAFTSATNHMSVAPEKLVLDEFIDQIIESGYSYSTKIFRIKYKESIDFDLLKRIIQRSIEVKKDHNKFWL